LKSGTSSGTIAASVIAAIVATAALTTWAIFASVASQPIDFRVYYLAAEVWSHGGSPYAMSRAAWFAYGHRVGLHDFVWPYRYPPYTAAALRPFVSLGEPAVLATWQSASVASTAAAAWLLARALGGRTMYVAAFLLLLGLAPAYDTLLVGQINGFLLLSLAVAFWAMLRHRERTLGASLAVGTALKLVPAALVIYLLARRRWRATVWFVVGLAVLTLIAVPLVGVRAFIEYAQWAIDLVRPESVMNGPTNATFVGAMGRLLPHSLDLARALGRGLASAALLATVAFCWPRRERPHDDALAFAMIVAVLPLLPPFTWFHQLVLLLLPLLVVGQRLWRAGRRWELTLLAALLAATDAMWIFINPGYWFGLHVSDVYYRLSFPTLLCVALWTLCAREMWLVMRRPAMEEEAVRSVRTARGIAWSGHRAVHPSRSGVYDRGRCGDALGAVRSELPITKPGAGGPEGG
jgi:hypothetical protein